MFWHRGAQGDTNGRVWIAVNGQQLFNYTGNLWGVANAWIKRIMVHQLYTRKPAKQSWTMLRSGTGFRRMRRRIERRSAVQGGLRPGSPSCNDAVICAAPSVGGAEHCITVAHPPVAD